MNTRKSLILFLLAFSFAFAGYGQANFIFDKTEHSFGDVPAGKDTLWVNFKFTNNGSEPLQISSVTTSCDCTLAEWPKDAVQPGKSAIIRGGFKIEGKSGPFDKSIVIFANTQPGMTILIMKGNVVDKK